MSSKFINIVLPGVSEESKENFIATQNENFRPKIRVEQAYSILIRSTASNQYLSEFYWSRERECDWSLVIGSING